MKEEFLKSIREKIDEGVFGKESFVRGAQNRIKSSRSGGRPGKGEK